MLTVGHNLDRTGQTLAYFPCYSDYLYTFLDLSSSFQLYSSYSYLFYSKDKKGLHTLESYTEVLRNKILILGEKTIFVGTNAIECLFL
jgi:hypothetical protein